jgi:hypothetical protein
MDLCIMSLIAQRDLYPKVNIVNRNFTAINRYALLVRQKLETFAVKKTMLSN